MRLLKKLIFYGTPLNPSGGTYLNPGCYKATLGVFLGGKKLTFSATPLMIHRLRRRRMQGFFFVNHPKTDHSE
jgi:hypothetical protein